MSDTVPVALVGNKGLYLSLQIGAATAVGLSGNVKSVKITPEDRDDADVTFLEAYEGDAKDYKVTVTAIQSTLAGSLWRLLWDNPGADDITLTYGPHGNAVPAVGKGHFEMIVKANGRPEVGTTARRGKDRETFEYTFDVLEGPELVES